MKILSVNAGSSSLKFTLIELPAQNTVASGLFEKIGFNDSFYSIKFNGENIEKKVKIPNHQVSVSILMEELIHLKIINSLNELDGIGHRVVHGGSKFVSSVVIDDAVIEEIEKCSDLAPLHNPANIVGIKAFMEALPDVVNVAVFDTSFHQTMKPENYLYPIPYELYEKYGIRKYGFHGTSHKYINKVISEYFKKDNLKVISCHIGNGASICAIDEGKVVDTTMGFTPLAGVMMGTRSGDIDSSIIEYLMKKSNLDISGVMELLNKKSGLLGVSGLSSDSRDVEYAADKGDEKSILAQKMYAQKIANYIAIYNNLLNGADVICLTAGVGENSKNMREMIVERIASLGIKLDRENNDFRGEFRLITLKESKIPVFVVPTNEELMIALETLEFSK